VSDRATKKTNQRSTCPIACTLDIVGDQWTLLIVRDLLNGKKRFGELLASDERISPSVLADRMRRLEQHRIVTSKLYSRHPPRAEYTLTPKGLELAPVLRAIGAWGLQHLPGTRAPSKSVLAPR
jgi:DNA-binding HxlR family transcriptional regulator